MKAGQIIGDRYKIIKVLGQGGTSVVYLAENIVLNNLWAIKALSKNSEWFSSDMKEITILKGLSHPMLPRIVDFLEDSDCCYIVMDYISGINLLEYIQMYGKVAEDKLLLWTRSILEVLGYLHDRNPPIVYRDMKPANLILDQNERICLVDFGTALLHRDEATEDTVYIGTQGYAAPEQYGLGRSDARTDLFNLGMTLIHLSTGIHPLKIEKLEKALKQSEISAKFIRFIMELIQTDPDKRPHDSVDALKKFERITTSGKVFLRESHKEFVGGQKSIIGISSILPNSGVTSMCLMIGSYLKKHGFHIALAELNSSHDFSRLYDVFEQTDSLKCKSDSCFEALGMTFFPEVSKLYEISRKKYDILILDIGFLKNDDVLRELDHSNIRLILCPAAIWKFPQIFEAQEKFKSVAQDDWIYAVCSPQKQEEQMLKKQYLINPVVTFPVPLNPFYVSREDEKQIGRALEHVFHFAGQKVTF